MQRLIPIALFAFALAYGCSPASLRVWSSDPPDDDPARGQDRGWIEGPARGGASPGASGAFTSPSEEPVRVRDLGDGIPRAFVIRGGALREDEPRGEGGALFRNTYYDFPREGAGAKAASIFDAACVEIAQVTQDFHDRVCVQGSGRLASGATVSFAKRDCACASACPRTGQKICFERLDPARFPHGRGATGRPITPLRTVAVDTSVIPLGAAIFIPEFAGVPRPDGATHDGCFVAEDRGLKVTGRQVDVFTGDPAATTRYNALVPSNQGVHVRVNDPRCHP
jgi:3D (Asp-Asp-Asp) domain-containing protein